MLPQSSNKKVDIDLWPHAHVENNSSRLLSRYLIVFKLVCLMLALSACGDSNRLKRYEVSGTVLLDGRPAPLGEISFSPDASQGNSGPGSVARIVDGKYRTQPGKGIVGGPYRVRTVVYDGVATDQSMDGTPLTSSGYEENVVFAKSATFHDVSVPRAFLVKVP